MSRHRRRPFAAPARARGEAALVPFLMAGDPDLDATRALLRAAAEAGADLIELGVPFSDPTADGPVIQRAGGAGAARAARRCAQILELVAELRRGGFDDADHPVRLLQPDLPLRPGAAAPTMRSGPASTALLVVDLPPEEADELWQPARAAGLDVIFLLAPTSDRARVRAVLRKASGFVYYVSMTGVTGAKAIDAGDVRRMVERAARARAGCRSVSASASRTPEQAAAVASLCRRGGRRQRDHAAGRVETASAGPRARASARSSAR